jgi:hypothetical protein
MGHKDVVVEVCTLHDILFSIYIRINC